MLRLLVIDQDFQIVKVSLAVIAPWPGKDFLDVGVLSLGFSHDGFEL